MQANFSESISTLILISICQQLSPSTGTHDGVPWNNNNAEHAIKRFAFLRKVIGGSSTAKGIKEHLVLLSVCETTLRLRGLSVLKFFISGAVDVDVFAVSGEQ